MGWMGWKVEWEGECWVVVPQVGFVQRIGALPSTGLTGRLAQCTACVMHVDGPRDLQHFTLRRTFHVNVSVVISNIACKS